MFRFKGYSREQLTINVDSGSVVITTEDCIGSADIWLDPEAVESVVTALRASAAEARQQLANRELGEPKP